MATFQYNFKFATNQLPSEELSCASKVNGTLKLYWVFNDSISVSKLQVQSTVKQPSCLPISSSGPEKMVGRERRGNCRMVSQATQTPLLASRKQNEEANERKITPNWMLASILSPLAHLILYSGILLCLMLQEFWRLCLNTRCVIPIFFMWLL